ncbi:MAG TPA: hypothetical protein VF765_12635 [Polyangiaceae bacterium]
MALGNVQSLESAPRARGRSGPLQILLDVKDPEVVAELRRHPEGEDRDAFAAAALRLGVLALRMANGHLDTTSIRNAGEALVGQMRELLSSRAAEMTEKLATTLRAHVGADDSLLAKAMAAHLGQGSPVFKLLSPDDATGLRAQLAKTIEDALADQRKQILREFSMDHEGSALRRLLGEFSLDRDGSALARLKKEVLGTIEKLSRDNVEFQSQVREALVRIDTRKKEEARTTRHGVAFEEHLGALLAEEAQRLGDLYEATGDTTGAIKQCKKGDCVVQLGAEAAAAHARIVWEAKEKQSYSVRAALEEIEEARRNRQAQVGVFVYSRKTAPEGLESLQRYGADVVAVWDADDPASDLVVRAAYSLARALAVRERASGESQAALGELEQAARAVERQITYLDDVRKWAETVKGHGEKIAERSARMGDELRREVERLDTQIASMRKVG